MKARFVLLVGVLACLSPAALVFAQTQSSEHYQVQQPTLSGGATKASSESYSAQTSAGEGLVGSANAALYVDVGFNRAFFHAAGSGGGGGGAGGGAGVAIAGNGPIVSAAGCGDPVAFNYSPAASDRSDIGCVYPPALSKTGAATIESESVSPAKPLPVSSSTVSARAAPSPSHLSIDASRLADELALSARLRFGRGNSGATVVFSVVRPDGVVATSSMIESPNGTSSAAYLFRSLALPPGSYTLHAHVRYADGTHEDANQPFVVADGKTRQANSFGIVLVGLLTVALAYLVARRPI
jgi:hypothetical protein